MKDTDNSEFLNQREDNQLTLVFDVVVTPEKVRPINAVLDDCAKNIQYFGLCQITGDRCDVRFDPPSVIAARAKELEMRQQEAVK